MSPFTVFISKRKLSLHPFEFKSCLHRQKVTLKRWIEVHQTLNAYKRMQTYLYSHLYSLFCSAPPISLPSFHRRSPPPSPSPKPSPISNSSSPNPISTT
ncbi:hypothetical protein L1887_05422 [Cichorium endivia]|nr:hypothetical protein L1887_05422 [Cichorium endivia]